MIKSIFDYDEEPQPTTPKQDTAETTGALRNELEAMNAESGKQTGETEADREVRQIFSKIIELPREEVRRDDETKQFVAPSESVQPAIDSFKELPHTFQTEAQSPLSEIFSDYKNEENFPETTSVQDVLPTQPENQNQLPLIENQTQSPPTENIPSLGQTVSESPIIFHHQTESLSAAETIRQSGLAWSAAIGLFGSVVFMMILGWIIDVLTGASPIGLVVGIIIGAAVGFYQFFRVTSMIFKK